jgi:hypothetical protein
MQIDLAREICTLTRASRLLPKSAIAAPLALSRNRAGEGPDTVNFFVAVISRRAELSGNVISVLDRAPGPIRSHFRIGFERLGYLIASGAY